ncbi:uncharacterized protein LOC129885029 [Solanum dulcamara]|uniref:uncharacterized protein LOC129885029 n=1 Tax=Solanum dulcamara TaxID=45834 RepID=UPI0024859BCC|nr:uncharacterized protein LOC129885029 [Solanum dulcamara]
MSKQGVKQTCSMCKQQGHNKRYCKVAGQSSEAATHNSQFTGQRSQGSCQPEPKNFSQSEPKKTLQAEPTTFSQPASTTSSKHAFSTTVCADTSRVKRVNDTISSQPPSYVDKSIPFTRGITSQLPRRRKETVGRKRGVAATGEDSARGGTKKPSYGGSSNVGFGIFTSASGTQILNPGTSSQRILPTGSNFKDASSTGIDLSFKPRGLR